MESEESRPGSSASNSSTNSSRQSSQAPKSPTTNQSIASPNSSTGGRSRPRSRSSNEAVTSPRSPSKSDSDSSSSSSSSDNENDESIPVKSMIFSNRCSAERSLNKSPNAGSRNPSVSPVNSRPSSRNSSSSSGRSCSNSRDNVVNPNGSNMNHEDLSDVSDMESEKRVSSLLNNSKQSMVDEGTNSSVVAPALEEEDECTTNSQDTMMTDLRQKLDKKKNQLNIFDKENVDKVCANDGNVSNGSVNVGERLEDDLVKTHDEDALDFEAEEGECAEVTKEDEKPLKYDGVVVKEKKNDKSDGEAEDGEELEEGEVSDEDEKRPEETEPKPVCRFYTRGQCTWGMSCRFLHPGVTDKGNYTMFDLVRPVPLTQSNSNGARNTNYPGHSGDYHDYRTDRPPLHHRGPLHHVAPGYPAHHDPRPIEGPVVVESAWERGLRTAKEMMRKANKRKEQDMDFEDKKMNLTLSPDDLEKDPYYLKERGSPPEALPTYGRHAMYQEAPGGMYSPPDRYNRGSAVPAYDDVDPYGRTNRYRELPAHRMPQYEDDRRVRPTREVIVQRVEPASRGDEWNDPWMRSKSPVGRGLSRDRNDKRRRDQRSYSSNSSYSSSSSSQSDSSSESSQSRSPADHRRRYNTNSKKSPLSARRHGVRAGRSPSSPPLRRARHSPSLRRSPMNKRRGHISPSPTLVKRGVHSPVVHKRKKLSPMLKKYMSEKSKMKRRHTSSSSGTDSSDSSGSDSDSDSGTSSSGSSSRSRDHTPPKRLRGMGQEKILHDRKLQRKVDPPKRRSPISIEVKKPTTIGASVFTSPSHSISSEKDSKKSRREELLKQLRAVEDAIAKKRSKLA